MAKIGEIQEVAIGKLKPYERNAKLHPHDQVQKLADSIQEFGFLSPCLIDREYNLIAGHGRVEACKLLGMETVPCLFIEGLTDTQKRAYILADNKLTELGGWDFDIVQEELKALEMLDFEIDLTGFNVPSEANWFEDRKRNDNAGLENESQEYQDFVEKFEAKKTTDDCYTPDLVYEAVADWVANEYGVDKSKFVRPFYPNGDYTKENYASDCVVVDNPPFSILSEIIRFYADNNIKFFLFCSGLTAMSGATMDCCAVLSTCNSITYENGAKVSTSFLTNLCDRDIAIMSCPSLYKVVKEADEKVQKALHKEQRKYAYPPYVITATMVGAFSKYGVPFLVRKSESVRITGLDSQKDTGDAIFGGGLLISEREKAEREKAEREKAEVWELSSRERQLIATLGKEGGAS